MTEQKSSVFTCGICTYDDLSLDLKVRLECNHVFCKDCMEGYLENKITEAQTNEDSLKCPEIGCGKPILYHVFKNLVSKEVMVKYDKFMMRNVNKVLDNDDEFFY